MCAQKGGCGIKSDASVKCVWDSTNLVDLITRRIIKDYAGWYMAWFHIQFTGSPRSVS